MCPAIAHAVIHVFHRENIRNRLRLADFAPALITSLCKTQYRQQKWVDCTMNVWLCQMLLGYREWGVGYRILRHVGARCARPCISWDYKGGQAQDWLTPANFTLNFRFNFLTIIRNVRYARVGRRNLPLLCLLPRNLSGNGQDYFLQSR